jgi:regulator of sirC expression with transglutaminase-like and TPR domain
MAMTTTLLDYWSLLVREDASLPVFEAALAIAQDEYPALDMLALLHQVDQFGSRLRARIPADAPTQYRIHCLNQLFFKELGFRGNANDYYDPDNSYLNRVIERRCGLPITLSLLYMEIGQQAGIPLQGVAFPGHYLVKVKVGGGEAFLDIFNGGASLSYDDLIGRIEPGLDAMHGTLESVAAFLHPANPRETLARTLRNLKNIYRYDKDWKRLLDVQRRMVILLPDEPTELRDRGLAYAHLDCPSAAIDDLQAYLVARPQADDRNAIGEQIEFLRHAVGRLN